MQTFVTFDPDLKNKITKKTTLILYLIIRDKNVLRLVNFQLVSNNIIISHYDTSTWQDDCKSAAASKLWFCLLERSFMVDPLSYFSFQPVFHDWCSKGHGMC